MTVGQIIGTGLSRALGLGVVADLVGNTTAGNTTAGVLGLLKDHFMLDGRDLAAAFQDSLARGAGAIALGVCPQAQDALERLAQQARRALTPQLARTYAAAVERDFLLPYARSRGLSPADLARLRRRTLDGCQALAEHRTVLLPAAELDDETLAILAQGAFRDDLGELLLARAAECPPDLGLDLDPEVGGLLAHRGLLGDALLWFLRERLRTDPRVRIALETLQREGLWADLRDLKSAVTALTQPLEARLDQGRAEVAAALESGDFGRAAQVTGRLPALAERRDRLPALLEAARGRWQAGEGALLCLPETPAAFGALVETGLEDLALALAGVAARLDAAVAAAGEARDAARDAGSRVEAWGGRLAEELESLGSDLDRLPQAVAAVVLRVLRPADLGLRVSPGDEFSHHDAGALDLIRQARDALGSLPPGPEQDLATLAVGSALSSTGAAAAAEALFRHAEATATGGPVRALAAYNLFQVLLRQGPERYPEALEALRRAVDLDRDRYATHEDWKYETQAILGAGGMGCAFLCREPIEGGRAVVVKTFWRAAPGAAGGRVADLFAEAMTMKRVGGAHVPALLNYGLTPGGRRPYIVMEYLDGYRDGEAWLAAQGPLSLAQGLDLGRRVLNALAVAHGAGVVHLDLKPSNLLLKAAAGEAPGIEVRVIDFGLARVAERVEAPRLDAAAAAGLSVLGAGIAGTRDYAAPEQLGHRKYGAPGPQSDLYAFGATWYRLMSGQPPGNRRARYLPAGAPEALFDLIQDLLEHDPKKRPESAAAVLARLDALAGVAAASGRDATAPPVLVPEFLAATTPARRPQSVPEVSEVSEVPDLHGWPADRVQALQQAAATALGLPVVFRDPDFEVRLVERVRTGRRLVRKRWLRADEYAPVYEERERRLTVSSPEMVVVPAGRFLMGSAASESEREEDEGPQHPVTLSRPFAIGRHAVTFDEYDAFCVATGETLPDDQGWGRARRPVVNVNWDDAVRYCQWLSQQTGRPYRLPREAEWEYACRAGTATPFHCGGRISPEQANYNGNYPYAGGPKGQYRAQTVPVGSLPPNPWRLCEMHGNVWEWCEDRYARYRNGPTTDPSGPPSGGRRVLRGGSWISVAGLLRSASRDQVDPGRRDRFTGFRLALGPELQPVRQAG